MEVSFPGCARELLIFKNQLQEYAQKAGLLAPAYEIERDGPSHEPRFKAKVTLQDVTYESPAFYTNSKKAEHAAAEVALLALGKDSDVNAALPGPLHESGLCKNMLQEYAQKCKLPLPVYRSERSGEIHSASFSSIVEIAGVHYKGGIAKNKKEAEIKAAKTALIAILSDTRGPPQPCEHQKVPVSRQCISADAAATLGLNSTQSRGKKRGRRRRIGSKDGRAVKAKTDNKPTEKQEKGTVEDSLTPNNQHTGNHDLQLSLPIEVIPEQIDAQVLTEVITPVEIPHSEIPENNTREQQPSDEQGTQLPEKILKENQLEASTT